MRFLYARAWIGTERPGVLFDLATTWLLDKKVLLPGVTTLTRLISSIRERVAERLWQRLSEVCTPEQRTDLEGLLACAGASRISNLERLRRAPSRASAPVGCRPTRPGACSCESDQSPGTVCCDNQSPKHCQSDR